MTKIKDQYGDPFTIKIKEKQTRKGKETEIEKEFQ